MALYESGEEAPRIVALQGASCEIIQGFLSDFAEQMAHVGFRISGTVEVATKEGRSACKSRLLRDLYSGAVISISQDLGPGSTACNLDPGGLAEACAAIERAISAGVDIVILSKFGKLEAERGGLSDAFRAAIAADLPIVTAVSPMLSEQWRAFAGELSGFMAPETGALDAWWLAQARQTFAIAAE